MEEVGNKDSSETKDFKNNLYESYLNMADIRTILMFFK